MIIGIAGKKGSGKDTLGRMMQGMILQTEANLSNKEVVEMAKNKTPLLNSTGFVIKKFAGKLKEVAGVLLGVHPSKFEEAEFKASTLDSVWDYKVNGGITGWETKSMTVREFLQRLGTDAIRNGLHPNAWVNSLFADYVEGKSNWIITDVRFKNEADAIRKRGGIMLRINRPQLQSDDDHPSETALDDYKYYNGVIDNSGSLMDLYEWVLAWDGLDNYINNQ